MHVLFILSEIDQLQKPLAMNFLQYAGVSVGALAATATAMDYMFPWLKYDLHYIKKLVSAKRMLSAFERSNSLLIDVFEKRCREIPQKTFLIFKVSVFQQAKTAFTRTEYIHFIFCTIHIKRQHQHFHQWKS